jgi:hypothetical protein
MLILSVPDPTQYEKVWQDYVIALNGEYQMTE